MNQSFNEKVHERHGTWQFVKPKLEYVDIFDFYIYVPGKQVVVSKKTAQKPSSSDGFIVTHRTTNYLVLRSGLQLAGGYFEPYQFPPPINFPLVEHTSKRDSRHLQSAVQK